MSNGGTKEEVCSPKLTMAALFSVLIISLHLCWGTSQVANASNGEDVATVVDVLTSDNPTSSELEAAQQLLGRMTDDQLTNVVGQLAQDIATRARGDIGAVVDLAFVALKKGGRNPFGKLVDKIKDAIEQGGANGIAVFTDPLSAPSKIPLANQLVALTHGSGNPLTTDQGLRIVNQLEAKLLEEKRRAQESQKDVNAKTVSPRSLTFTAANQRLSFTNDLVVSVVDKVGGVRTGDPIVGAQVLIPNFMFVGYTPEGLASFLNTGQEPLVVLKGSDVFFRAAVPSLIYDGHELFSFASEVVFAGASPGSPFNGDLPDLGSFFTDSLNELLTPHPFEHFVAFSILPDSELIGQTANFSRDATIAFTDALYVPSSVPEPSTWLLLGSGLVGIAVFGRKRLTKKM